MLLKSVVLAAALVAGAAQANQWQTWNQNGITMGRNTSNPNAHFVWTDRGWMAKEQFLAIKQQEIRQLQAQIAQQQQRQQGQLTIGGYNPLTPPQPYTPGQPVAPGTLIIGGGGGIDYGAESRANAARNAMEDDMARRGMQVQRQQPQLQYGGTVNNGAGWQVPFCYNPHDPTRTRVRCDGR